MTIFDRYDDIFQSVSERDVIICVKTDTLAWTHGAEYIVLKKEPTCLVVAPNLYFGEIQWLWPWNENQQIAFAKKVSL